MAVVPVMAEATVLKFPLDVFEASDEQQRTLGRAQSVLIARCMARFGFTYRGGEERSPERPESVSRRFGVGDPRTAERYGYANPSAARAPQKRVKGLGLTRPEEIALLGEPDLDPAKLPNSQQEAEQQAAGAGKAGDRRPPAGGCTRESYLKLYAPRPDSVDLLYVFNLRNRADSEYREDSRVRAVDKSWSACMAKSGYKVTDPHDAADELGLGDRRSSAEAITAAKTDVRCKRQVNLLGVHYSVLSAYEQRAAEQNAETLKLVKDQLDERLRTAAALTG
ncbi:hypothetical protein ASE09_04670 [Streptomyces sp. Root66D1]|nr:hypothetical protein ASD33_04665 [Streptomyces sp. Root1304]KRB00818.1 hypothetical protein ASE09_04670 [Streptomyces sp. Root66D1]